MLFSKNEVIKFLPHRDPFLFIDSVESIVCGDWKVGDPALSAKEAVGGKVLAHFKVSNDLEVFKGHFPGKPILPGVLQVEIMAQAASFVMAFFAEKPLGGNALEVALASVNNAKFRAPVLPGANLVINAEVKKYRVPMIVTACSIYSEDQLVSQAEITALVRL